MKTLFVITLSLVLGINAAKSQVASFTFKVEDKKVTTFNTSAFSKTNTDSFAANWYFEGEGNFLFENFDSASYNFLTGGNYRVILTLNHFIKDPVNPNDWIRKQDTIQSISTIPIEATNIFNISGIVKWRGTNINQGNVHLLKRSESGYVPVRFSSINGAGNYSFTNLTNDTFIIWVQPIVCDTCNLNSSNVISTYFGNSHKIDSALKVIPTSNLTNLNIDLKEPSELNGLLKLKGKVLNGNDIAGNIALLLYDKIKSKVFRYSLSNILNGEYSIEKIETGDYLLQPVINGVPYSPINISISTDNSILDINLSTLTTSVKEQFKTPELLSVYPNPFTDRINIYHSNQNNLKSLSIINLQGQVIFKSESIKLNHLDLSELNNGLYYITLTDINGVSNTIRIHKN